MEKWGVAVDVFLNVIMPWSFYVLDVLDCWPVGDECHFFFWLGIIDQRLNAGHPTFSSFRRLVFPGRILITEYHSVIFEDLFNHDIL